MEWALEASKITKSFSGVEVLKDVSLQLRAGEVHALMGENGAGKSTLMKVVAGMYAPDSGTVRVQGELVPPGNPHASLRAGVAMIFQELSPFPDLSIAENILMGLQPTTRFAGWIDKRAMQERARELLRRLRTPLETSRKLRTLRVAEMQVVEIAKALAHNARIIIMDEPTSALSEAEAEALFGFIDELRRQGVAIVYISHKIDEVFRLADRITVLRDGSHVITGATDQFTPERLIGLMVGRETSAVSTESGPRSGRTALVVRHLCREPWYRDISFEVMEGEILGLAGLMGAGRTEVVNGIFGLERPDSGEIFVHDQRVRIRGPKDALRAGIGLVSEDRKLFGIVPTMTIPPNVTLAGLEKCTRAGFVRRSAERRAAEKAVSALGIRTRNAKLPVERLSGGNQQKVVIGRTLFTEPKVLLLDEPTRGIDVNARAEIHSLIRGFAREGKAVLLVSSEMPELLGLSDRIMVLRQGNMAGSLAGTEASAEAVLKMAMPR